MTNKKQKSVASIHGGTASTGNVILGFSGVIRWDDVMTIQGFDVKISKAVELGLKHGLEIATKLEEDLKSKTGLLLTFPMAMLMSQLQALPEIGDGQTLLELTRP